MSNEKTTREGVDEEVLDAETASDEKPSGDGQREQKSSSQLIRERIVAKRKEQMQAEPEQDEESVEEQEEQEPESVAKTRKVKVYGEEKEVPEEEIIEAGIRTYQKETAADVRLREAAEKQRAIEAREAALAELEKRLEEQQRAEPTKKESRATAEVDDEFLTSVVDSLMDGEEDRAKAAIKEIINRAQHREERHFSETEISRMVQQEVDRRETAREAEQRKTAMNDANAWFSQNYGWVEQDPGLESFAQSQGKRLVSEHPEWSPHRVVEEIGKTVDAFVSRFKQPENDPLEHKREAKRQTDNPPAASGRAPSPPESKPKTKRDAFAEIKKARGQSVI